MKKPLEFRHSPFEDPRVTQTVRSVAALVCLAVAWVHFSAEAESNPDREYLSKAVPESVLFEQEPVDEQTSQDVKEPPKEKPADSPAPAESAPEIPPAETTPAPAETQRVAINPPLQAPAAVAKANTPAPAETPVDPPLPVVVPPVPPAVSVSSRGSVDSVGESFPSYRFSTLAEYEILAERHEGIFLGWNPVRKAAVRIGRRLDSLEMTSISQLELRLLGYAIRMAELPEEEDIVRAIAAEIQQKDPRMTPVKIMLALPSKVDEAIADAQEAGLQIARREVCDRWKTELRLSERNGEASFSCWRILDLKADSQDQASGPAEAE
jgi:hypothetical protein